jgi:peptidoglycan/xylan/chitin deacetylase (PgdA/CDA1 family)
MTTAAITIDVDSLRFYREIHGLPPLEPREDPIYRTALPRFFALLEEARVPATLFLIGEDAALHLDAFAPARPLGCEIASHTYAHDYRITARSKVEIDRDLARAEQALSPLADRIEGFRAPGYNVSPALLECVVARGYAYDSSLLPAPAYWAGRALAIARYAAGRRPSRSLIGDARAFAGPVEPYRTTPSRPWRKSERGALLEIPVACEPTTRIPLLGTWWTMMPEGAREKLLARAIRKLPCINFEMHPIDLLDRSDPGVPSDLAAAQPDLRVRAEEKRRAFRNLFRRLRAETDVMTLRDIAHTRPFSRGYADL